jgi:hypothetical protein
MDLAADIGVGTFLQITCGLLQWKGTAELADQTLEAALRALDASSARRRRKL